MRKQDTDGTIGAALKAALAYFALVFACGFALGAIRTLILVPYTGELRAVVLELPLMLLASWVASSWLTARFSLGTALLPRAVMGGLAFVLLQGAELLLGCFMFGRPVTAFLPSFQDAPNLIGLAGQIAFALIPMLQACFNHLRIHSPER
ncbi:MAG TPA: hypothetical protein VEH07_03480 [Alphaproteobacteria bacterium]|nr:hypothetical protein [Alphaproteobacteria bacterium]